MRFYHMEDQYDELRCPRCGMVIKKAGVPLRGSISQY
jgi:PHP family Zn ribbon phosphoesterase